MSKPPPKFCEQCGEQPRDPRFYPLEKIQGMWVCKRCKDNEREEKRKAAKNN
jgi:hypothetical protein